MSRRRSLPETAPPLDDEDLLREILLRLPPNPSSLPRASAVCKRWRNILLDAGFLRRFRQHHRKAPLLGFFSGGDGTKHSFNPVMDSPDRIPAARFPVPLVPFSGGLQWELHGCRHGLAVLVNKSQRELVVWDPLSGQQHRVPFPQWKPTVAWNFVLHAAVLCDDAGDGHGDRFSTPFKVVLMCGGYMQASSCLYVSAHGVWGDVVSMATTYPVILSRPSILVGGVIYRLISEGVLAFDLETQSLEVVEKPADVHAITTSWFLQLLRTKDGGLGLAYLSKLAIQLWERKSNRHGVVGWVLLHKIIQLDGIIPNTIHYDYKSIWIVGYDEDTNLIVLSTSIGNFMLQLDSMQIKHITKRDRIYYDIFYPCTNFYTPGNRPLCTFPKQEKSN